MVRSCPLCSTIFRIVNNSRMSLTSTHTHYRTIMQPTKNAAASALVKIRWDKTSKAARVEHAMVMVRARLKKMRARKRNAGKIKASGTSAE